MTTIKSSHRKVSVSDLVIDPRVQRREGFDHRRVDRMAAERELAAETGVNRQAVREACTGRRHASRPPIKG